MNKTEKLVTIICSECKNAFPIKVTIKIGTEGTKETEIDVNCPYCGELLTTVIKGKLHLNQVSLRLLEGKPKTSTNELDKFKNRTIR